MGGGGAEGGAEGGGDLEKFRLICTSAKFRQPISGSVANNIQTCRDPYIQPGIILLKSCKFLMTFQNIMISEQFLVLA